jgi:hypothetical protein
MELINKADWELGLKNNQDPYGAAGYRFAELWANLMEEQIAQGKTLAECAETTSHEADTEGITGFMYGCAVSVLAHVWKHGEELRKWHNLDTQIRDEGEKANESGRVLNPAIINIK